MKKNLILKSTIVLFTAIVFMSSCASSTMISSIPSGAKVYINGESVGTTPYLHTDTKVVGSLINVDLIKEGYEPIYASFTRTEQINTGALVGGFFIWPIWLWTMDYKPTHNYEMVPIAALMQNDEIMNTQSQEPQMIKSKAERLKELKHLFDEKLITEQEYIKEKQKILDEK